MQLVDIEIVAALDDQEAETKHKIIHLPSLKDASLTMFELSKI